MEIIRLACGTKQSIVLYNKIPKIYRSISTDISNGLHNNDLVINSSHMRSEYKFHQQFNRFDIFITLWIRRNRSLCKRKVKICVRRLPAVICVRRLIWQTKPAFVLNWRRIVYTRWERRKHFSRLSQQFYFLLFIHCLLYNIHVRIAKCVHRSNVNSVLRAKETATCTTANIFRLKEIISF